MKKLIQYKICENGVCEIAIILADDLQKGSKMLFFRLKNNRFYMKFE